MPQADQLALIFLNGITFSMLLYLLAAGLMLMLGVMNIINLAHGSFYMLGAFIGWAVATETGNFLLGTIAGMGVVGFIGFVMERFFLRRITDHLRQVLFTLGCVYIIWDLARVVWGSNPQWLSPPSILSSSISIGEYQFPTYRLAVILFGAITAIALWLLVARTRIGAIIRAGADDREMVGGVGVNIKLIYTAVFTMAALLAGLSGVLGTPVLTANLTLDWEILTLALVVMVVGGLRTLNGALLGSFLIGLVYSFGIFFFPEAAMFVIFGVMALILAFRPQGVIRQS